MATTYTLISSTTLTGTSSQIDFTSIPATYTDLVLKISGRMSDTGQSFPRIRFNDDTANNYSDTVIQYDSFNAAVNSLRDSNNSYIARMIEDNATNTSSTFSNQEIYIPSYQVSANKPLSVLFAREQNASTTDNAIGAIAGLWRNTAAITKISIIPISTTYASGSSFYLYGIKNS